MSHITKEQLTHLAKLARLELTAEDEAELLPQLEKILEFVGQLQEASTDSDQQIDRVMPLREGVEEAGLADKLLANVKHPIKNQSIEVTGKLSEK